MRHLIDVMNDTWKKLNDLKLTRVDDWFFRILPEEKNGRQCKHTEFLGHFLIVDFHEIDAGAIRLIVDMFNFSQYTGALLAVIANCTT